VQVARVVSEHLPAPGSARAFPLDAIDDTVDQRQRERQLLGGSRRGERRVHERAGIAG